MQEQVTTPAETYNRPLKYQAPVERARDSQRDIEIPCRNRRESRSTYAGVKRAMQRLESDGRLAAGSLTIRQNMTGDGIYSVVIEHDKAHQRHDQHDQQHPTHNRSK